MSTHPLEGLSIQPEPTDDELAALVTVLTVALRAPTVPAAPETTRSDRWARAGRVAALAPWPPAVRAHWRRAPGEADRS